MKKIKEMCVGCDNDFYNHRQNCDGQRKCWSFKSAKIVKAMLVHVDQCPPYKHNYKNYLSCYRPKRYVLVKEGQLTKDGYWKSNGF